MQAHAAALPAADERWIPGPHGREELMLGLLEGRVAGIVGHPLENVRRHIQQLHDGDPDKQFGMSGLAGSMSPERILELVARSCGFEPDHQARLGPVDVDPAPILGACRAIGDRLALACRRGERMIVATGHPVGLALLYGETARALAARGVQMLRPFGGVPWTDPGEGDRWEVRYLDSVGMLTDRAGARHTHSAEPMRRMLEEQSPDLVLADHGFAGAAIEAGIETLSIADVNDPALLVAQALGRTQTVLVMDDNVEPDAYWPCFQAIVARLPARSA